MSGTPNSRQNHYRFRTDANNADSGAFTWGANEDTTYYPGVDTNFHIRFALDNNGTANFGARRIAYSLNGGTYTLAGTATTVIKCVDGSSSLDNSNLTTANFQLTAGAGTASNGVYDESGDAAFTLLSTTYTELQFALFLISTDVTGGDTIDLRVYGNGPTPMDVYNVTPRITVPAGAGQPTVKRAGGVNNVFSMGRHAQNIKVW